MASFLGQTLHIFSLCISLVICPLVLLVLNAKSHWFWRQNLQPIIILAYCYSAMSSISPPRNTVMHSGLISYCTAINDSMWHRAQGLKIWLLQRLGFHSHLTPALLQMTRIRAREIGMKCLIINIKPPERMKASVFNKRTVFFFFFLFLNITIRLLRGLISALVKRQLEWLESHGHCCH